MEGDASGEELVIKARKPYTITKQRERWTEEEHNRFLEALKLYGRAWQKIEEHIGTKTAVQIRSHAQKFFTKLEKEALAKGVPVGQALDIDIPPPRPKRKPSTPYPRKTCNGTLTSQDTGKDENSEAKSLDCEKPNEGEGKPLNVKENQDVNPTGSFNLLQDAPGCSSVSSVNKNSAPTVPLTNSCTFREFLPLPKEAINDNGTDTASELKRSFCHMNDKSVTGTELNGYNGISPTDDQGTRSCPRHIPVQILDGSSVTCISPPNLPPEDSIFRPTGGIHGIGNTCADPSGSAISMDHLKEVRSSNYQTPCTFHPGFFSAPHTQENNGLFSNLIVSTILQNPVVHAAAAYAASFWPYANTDNHADLSRSFQHRQMNSPPSLAGITAATVAAATAWWATQGLLPLCTPFHTAVACWPQPSTTCTGQNPVAKIDPKEPNHQTPSAQDQDCPSKSASFSSLDSAESGHKSLKTGQKPDFNGEAAAESGMCDANGPKNRKQIDPSSCGSNTPSSDVETDALEKHEEVKEAEAGSLAASEPNTRRGKSSNNLGVSEEGRLAFHALFSRDVLPQSFSPPQATKEEVKRKKNDTEAMNQNFEDKDRYVLALDLNGNTQSSSSDLQEEKKSTLQAIDNKVEEGLSAIGLGNGRLKTRKTGFKPYKRCSVEAKENGALPTTSNQAGEKVPKRIRLEGEAST